MGLRTAPAKLRGRNRMRNPKNSFRNAQGIIPWRDGDELPEDIIRRLRDRDEDWRSIYSDWGNVGDDMRKVLNELGIEEEQPE